MTCRHALTDNQFTQVVTQHTTTVIISTQCITYTEVDDRWIKSICFDKYQWQGDEFCENNPFTLSVSKYAKMKKCKNARLQKAFAESRLHNFLLYSFKTKIKYIIYFSSLIHRKCVRLQSRNLRMHKNIAREFERDRAVLFRARQGGNMRKRQGSRGNARSRQECQREAARECGKEAVLKKRF